ncbi:MAG TPA: hypothetical protein ENJ40_02025 [Thermosulfurimonas dismutans]|uniref:Type II/III secretion system secretin-like domain-containing protein n=1 Tax=Thermosulfurimonas dismutans TaxID=999894 RepID=A0A7C3GS21_9BACT|nr:hypothetical protein [Thermosulfurimonas dismutans]
MWSYRVKGKFTGYLWVKAWFFSLSILLLFGCTARQARERVSPPPPAARVSAPPPPAVSPSPAESPEILRAGPIFKEVSPLRTRRLSLSLHQEDAFTVFHLLAREAGLNLVITREVQEMLPPEARLITAEFHDYTLEDLLRSLCRMLDLHYEIRGGVIYIQAFEERLFDLSFLQTLRGARFGLGGDVLGGLAGTGGAGTSSSTSSGGAGKAEFVSPLKGQYEISGEVNRKSTDMYRQIETSVRALLSRDGTFTFNRLTGNLFVRDHPSNVRRVAELVERLKKRYGRQVLIEAKIVEVDLSRGHDLGIDWLTLRDTRLPTVSTATLDLRNGMPTLTFSYQHRPSFEGVLRLLENYGRVHILSNPRIRVLNGQPALISVGRSVGYVREINREVISSENISQTQTTVDTSAIFDGLLLGVTPRITDSGIILHIVPIKSDLVELRREEFGTNTVVTLPQVNLREMSTVIRVTPHDLVIIGGLILDKKDHETRRVWGLGRLPGLGALFTHSRRSREKVELVILLRVSLV